MLISQIIFINSCIFCVFFVTKSNGLGFVLMCFVGTSTLYCFCFVSDCIINAIIVFYYVVTKYVCIFSQSLVVSKKYQTFAV